MSARMLSEGEAFSLRDIPELARGMDAQPAFEHLSSAGAKTRSERGVTGMFAIAGNGAAIALAKKTVAMPSNLRPATPATSKPLRLRANPLSIGGNPAVESQVAQLNAEIRNLKSSMSNERRLSQRSMEEVQARLAATDAAGKKMQQEVIAHRQNMGHLVQRDKFDQALAAVMKADHILVEKDKQIYALEAGAKTSKEGMEQMAQDHAREVCRVEALLAAAEEKLTQVSAEAASLQTALEVEKERAAPLLPVSSPDPAAAQAAVGVQRDEIFEAVAAAPPITPSQPTEVEAALRSELEDVRLCAAEGAAALDVSQQAEREAKENALSLAGLLETERACVLTLREELLVESRKTSEAQAETAQLKELGDPLQLAEEHAALRVRVSEIDAAVAGSDVGEETKRARESLVAKGNAVLERYNRFVELSNVGVCAAAHHYENVDAGAEKENTSSPSMAGVQMLTRRRPRERRARGVAAASKACSRVFHLACPPAVSPVGAALSPSAEVARRVFGRPGLEHDFSVGAARAPHEPMPIGEAILQDLSRLLKGEEEDPPADGTAVAAAAE